MSMKCPAMVRLYDFLLVQTGRALLYIFNRTICSPDAACDSCLVKRAPRRILSNLLAPESY